MRKESFGYKLTRVLQNTRVNMDTSGQLTDRQKEEAKFLERDFNQCFQQMRHYDGHILDIFKFAFTAYTAITGASLALYKYGHEKDIDYSLPAASLLLIGSLIGICLFALVVRNRVYFVIVTRYVNEHRGHFLGKEPLDLKIQTPIYRKSNQPSYFNWLSSQSLLLYVLAVLNSMLLGLGLFLLFDSFLLIGWLAFTASLILLSLQLIFAIRHLKSHGSKA